MGRDLFSYTPSNRCADADLLDSITMTKKILLQIDHDSHASPFDSIVAVDSGVDQLLTYSEVEPLHIEQVIHGAIFTRSPEELKNTAVFFGGTNVEKTEELFQQARRCFFGSLRVSIMADPNGSNTTAAAAVLRATEHDSLAGKQITILAGTGPVGQRIARLTAAAGGQVRICSRSLARAEATCQQIEQATGIGPTAAETTVASQAAQATADSDIVFAAGAAGVELLDKDWLALNASTHMAIDINAVPPVGINGIQPTDRGELRDGKICYGAIGVGQLKMKIHRAALRQLFESNTAILDIEEIFEIGKTLVGKRSKQDQPTDRI